jgi:multisubunit Na+/H+ antiporter MnhB subunit
MKSIISLTIIIILAYILVITVEEMPTFGSEEVPSYNEIAKRYTEDVVEDTGIVNSVTAILLDYRAFDTLGEATVLFAASLAVITVLKRR